jgi:hypothetical protein
LLTFLAHCKAGKTLFPFSSAQLNHRLIRLSRKGAHSPPLLRTFTCRSLRSGCISAAHSIGVSLSRIMALSGHSSSQVLIRHFLDAFISPLSFSPGFDRPATTSNLILISHGISDSQYYLFVTCDSCELLHDEMSKR